MNWNAQVTNTNRTGKTLEITVSYSNGDQSFEEIVIVDGTQSDVFLQIQIANTLSQLTLLDNYEQTVKALPIISSTVTLDQSGVLTDMPVTTFISAGTI